MRIDEFNEILKGYYEYTFIIVGLFWFIAAIFDCRRINEYNTSHSGSLLKRFIQCREKRISGFKYNDRVWFGDYRNKSYKNFI